MKLRSWLNPENGDLVLIKRLDLLIEVQRHTNVLLERLIAQEASSEQKLAGAHRSTSRSNRATAHTRAGKVTRRRRKGATQRSPGLHEEIEAVLREAGRPLRATVIAERIRERGNYAPPRSSNPLSGSNINSRVANPTYRSRFVRHADGIWLSTSEEPSSRG